MKRAVEVTEGRIRSSRASPWNMLRPTPPAKTDTAASTIPWPPMNCSRCRQKFREGAR